jgi:aryl-alcohol dehydrogenase-like predicted oxidoreductase
MGDLNRSKIILGCGGFGGVGSLPELIGKGESREDAFDLLDQTIRLEITRFDTANTYGGGRSESILGEWVQRQSAAVRRRIQISTKVGNPHGCTDGDRPLSRQQMEFHLERSLKRLSIERIDVYYLHELDSRTPLEETLEALSAALQKGKIAGFGLSNVGRDDVERILGVAGPTLGEKLTHIQNEFHFLHKRDAGELIPFLTARNIGYVAFGPLAGGLLTGKYEKFETPPQGSRLSLRPEPYRRLLTPETSMKISTFVEEARQKGLDPAEAALRFAVNTSGIDSVIIGPRKREHYESLGFKLGSS